MLPGPQVVKASLQANGSPRSCVEDVDAVAHKNHRAEKSELEALCTSGISVPVIE